MKQFYLLFLFTVLCFYSATSQTTSEIAFGGTDEESIVSVSQTIDSNGYVLLGTSDGFSSSTEAFLARTDNVGNYLWARTLTNTDTDVDLVAAIEAHGSTEEDQSYIICYHFEGSNLLNIVKYNYNSDSNVDSVYYNIDLNYMEAHTFVRTTNGYILVISSTNEKSVVLSFDDDLNLLANLGEQNSSAYITDVIVDDDRIFIAGTPTDNQYVYIIEVDEYLSTTGIGEKIFTVSFDQSETLSADEVQVARNSSGEFLIATSSSSDPTVGKVLIKTDSDGDNAVAYEYGTEGENDFYITDVASTDDGFALTGYTNSSYANSLGAEDVLFIHLSESITLDKASILGQDKSDKGQFIYKNSDGSATIFGTSCSFSAAGDVDVYVIKTDAGSTSPCNETAIDFTIEEETVSTGSGQILFNWDYSPGYSSSGTILTTTDVTFTTLCPCQQTLSFITSGTACEGSAVLITDLGSDMDYVWDFGNDVTDTTTADGTIYITYGSPGIRTISVSVADNSCYTSATQSVIIYPTPDITITTPSSACAGAALDFESSVTSEDGGPYQYIWDFGAGANPSSSIAANPVGISFQYGGSKEVFLQVQSDYCTNSETASIHIDSLPIPDIIEDGTIYADSCISIGGNAIEGASYLWSPSTTLSSATSANPEACPIANTSYYVTVTDANGCIGTGSVEITIVETPVSGIESLTNEDFRIYPNPASDNFIVTGFNGTATLCLYNAQGTRMLSKTNIDSGESINISTLPEGMYVITIQTGNKTVQKKLIKE